MSLWLHVVRVRLFSCHHTLELWNNNSLAYVSHLFPVWWREVAAGKKASPFCLWPRIQTLVLSVLSHHANHYTIGHVCVFVCTNLPLITHTRGGCACFGDMHNFSTLTQSFRRTHTVASIMLPKMSEQPPIIQ